MIMNSFVDFYGTGLGNKAHQVMSACRTENILPTLQKTMFLNRSKNPTYFCKK